MKKLVALLAAAMSLYMSGCVMPGAAEGAEAGVGGTQTIIMYLVVMAAFFGIMYFIAIRPEKKREKEQKAMLESMMVGDTCLTTSGFYGTVIDITADTVIVEFGNNKNCRIPMQKAAIVQIEHPEGFVAPTADTTAEKKDQK